MRFPKGSPEEMLEPSKRSALLSFVENLKRRGMVETDNATLEPGQYRVERHGRGWRVFWRSSMSDYLAQSREELRLLEEAHAAPLAPNCAVPECSGYTISSKSSLCKRCRERLYYYRRVIRHFEGELAREKKEAAA